MALLVTMAGAYVAIQNRTTAPPEDDHNHSASETGGGPLISQGIEEPKVMEKDTGMPLKSQVRATRKAGN